MAQYEQTLRLNTLPLLGHLPLIAVRRSHVQAMVASVGERLSPADARFARVVTGSVLKAAFLDRRPAVDPSLGAKPPEVHKCHAEVMITEQVLALEAAMPAEWVRSCSWAPAPARAAPW